MAEMTTIFTNKHTHVLQQPGSVTLAWHYATDHVHSSNSMPVALHMKDCFGENELPSMKVVQHELQRIKLSSVLLLSLLLFAGRIITNFVIIIVVV